MQYCSHCCYCEEVEEMTEHQEIQIKSLGEELAQLLIGMSDEEKHIALAMLTGMTVGKQIAEQKAE